MNDNELFVCKASLRFLKKTTGKWESRCTKALIENKGDLLNSARQLKATSVKRPYHDYYYLGDKKVESPDKDLPTLLSDPGAGAIKQVSRDGLIDGERFIAPFNDANSFEEIQGLFLSRSYYPVWEDWMINSVTIQGSLMELTDRLRDKMRRRPPEVLLKYYLNAISELQRAKDAYFDGKYYDGNNFIAEAHRWIVSCQNVKKKRTGD